MEKSQEQKLFQNANIIRGMVINATINLEQLIDYYIARHFCDTEEKQNEIVESLLGTEKINTDSKRQLMEAIIKKEHPDLYATKYKKLMRDIELRIIPKRNEFAHGIMLTKFTPEQLEEGGIGLIRYKGGEKINWYSFDDMIEFNNLIGEAIEQVSELYKIVKPSKH